MATITHKLLICDDCVQVIAHAATSEDTGSENTDTAADALAKNWPGVNVVVASTSDDDYEEFSPAPCGGCDTTLAGGRTPAVVFGD